MNTLNLNVNLYWKAALAGFVAFLVLLLLFIRGCGHSPAPLPGPAFVTQVHTDTVRYATKPFADSIPAFTGLKPPHKPGKSYFIPVKSEPVKLTVYEAPDTIRRAALQTDTLITGIKTEGDMIEVQTMTPQGENRVAEYKLPEPADFTLTADHKGNLLITPDEKELKRKKRRERWRKIGNWALIVVAFVAGTTLAVAAAH